MLKSLFLQRMRRAPYPGIREISARACGAAGVQVKSGNEAWQEAETVWTRSRQTSRPRTVSWGEFQPGGPGFAGGRPPGADGPPPGIEQGPGGAGPGFGPEPGLPFSGHGPGGPGLEAGPGFPGGPGGFGLGGLPPGGGGLGPGGPGFGPGFAGPEGLGVHGPEEPIGVPDFDPDRGLRLSDRKWNIT